MDRGIQRECPHSVNCSRFPPDFNDFVPFAGWTYPTVKKFDRADYGCGIYVDRDIYSTSSAAVADVARHGKSDRIVVGGLGLGNTAFRRKSRDKAVIEV
ncbi:hypothetical protein OSTOST_05527 [Ostertagia ostertagi]